jgi:glycerol transport system ATP-binding protein
VGYFIGSPGMNLLPVTIDGAVARLGSLAIELPGAVTVPEGAVTQLGVRPEYVRLGRDGAPAAIAKVEDIGRQKIVRASVEGQDIAVLLPEDAEIPSEPRVGFDPAGINIYADSWRVEAEPRP